MKYWGVSIKCVFVNESTRNAVGRSFTLVTYSNTCCRLKPTVLIFLIQLIHYVRASVIPQKYLLGG